MSVTGPTGPGRSDFGAADAGEVSTVAAELKELRAAAGATGDGRPTSRLAQRLLQDGKIDVADAKKLVQDEAARGPLTKSERTVFVNLLRNHAAQITPAALDVLAQHFNLPLRRPAGPTGPTAPTTGGTTTGGGMTITGDQRDGIRGTARPGDTIEAINLSSAPANRLHLEDTTVIATADASGKFTGRMPDVQEGDEIRMRRRGADGSVGDWVTITAHGISAQDTRSAIVNLDRVTLESKPDGTVEVGTNTDRPVTEPGAKVRFTNSRTGEKFDMTANDAGSVPQGFKLKGRPGDTFAVSVTDGRNDAALSKLAGTVRVPGGSGGASGVDLPDPTLVHDDKGYTEVRFHGPLFKDGPTGEDVRQGAIGDCYFPATFSAIAHSDPQAIKDMIRENPDGTYTVRFFKNGLKSSPKEVTVDGDLYTRFSGTPLYGTTFGNSNSPDSLEMWFPIIEKAYAQFKGGSYDKIGQGGNPGDLMNEALGTESSDFYIPGGNADRLFAKIKDGESKNLPMAAVTFGEKQDRLYQNTGIYSDHTYSIYGTAEEGGKKYVILRNPWGESEPGYGSDGKNDGIFKLELKDFMKLYESFSVAGRT